MITLKVQQYTILYDYSKFEIKRLERCNSQKAFEKQNKRKKSAYIINLERCSNVFMDL